MIDFARIEDLRQELVSLNSDFPPGDRLGPWRGPWQAEYAKLMAEQQYFTMQGPVQWSGKTMVGCLGACAMLLEGYRGIIAFPTLRQGGRVMLRRTSTYMTSLEPRYNIQRSKPDAAQEKTWSNGAILCALSTDESATAGIQGYTFDFIWIDEGHVPIACNLIGPLFSRAEIALEAGYGKIGIFGVGGAVDTKPELADGSVIEHVQTTSYFKSLRFDTKRVGSEYPAAANAFKRARELNTAQHYNQYYDCKPLKATGETLMFPKLGWQAVDGATMQEHSFTLDVAKGGSSRTICSHFIKSMLGDGTIHKQLIRSLIVEYEAMDSLQNYRAARLIAEFIQREQSGKALGELEIFHAHLKIEVNGPGKELADTFAARYPFVHLKRVHTNDQPKAFRKTAWIKDAMKDGYSGLLVVTDEQARSELQPLKFSTRITKGYLEYVWPQNDYLSTVWLEYAGDEKVSVA